MNNANDRLLNCLIEKLDVIFDYVQTHSGVTSGAANASIWYTSKEVCEMLKIHKRTLQRLRRNKIISYSCIGQRIIYRREDVEFLVSQRAVNCDTRHFIKTLYPESHE